MDYSAGRENGRHKADHYKPAQGQWLMQHQPPMKQIMTLMAERDATIQERNMALLEKKAALAERDMAFLQRDSAIVERNTAIMERDNAIATIQQQQQADNGKGHDLGLLNQELAYEDEETTMAMPMPICTCTGVPIQCYKWGNAGWQSVCCTKTLSMYPLPTVPNRKYARVAGRKMSGSAFNKLLTRLVLEGHDPSIPLDLKDHWAKHGTNQYMIIK